MWLLLHPLSLHQLLLLQGLNGGVIAGPRSEFPRPCLSLGPGGLLSTEYLTATHSGLGFSDSTGLTHADVLVAVVRGFEDGMLTHYEETVDPVRDFDAVQRELIAKVSGSE